MIVISEVGPRDGLQSISKIMPLEAKKAWIKAEYDAGISEIEVGSMVPSSLLPQMADTAELVEFARGLNGLTIAVLVPNLKGAKRAIEAGAHKISMPFSMSESHSLKNVKKNHVQMLEEIKVVADFVASIEVDKRPHFECGMATAFGCTIEGKIIEEKVMALAESVIEAGVNEICLSDTTGFANPSQVRRLVTKVKRTIGDEKLNSLHLHNTRGLGLANVVAGLDCGITTFDASLGGLGGCPFAPGASGNIVTEDLAFMLASMGIETGIDLNKLFKVREILVSALPGEEIYGFTPEAGLPLGYAK